MLPSAGSSRVTGCRCEPTSLLHEADSLVMQLWITGREACTIEFELREDYPP
jgi:hypothetical protein